MTETQAAVLHHLKYEKGEMTAATIAFDFEHLPGCPTLPLPDVLAALRQLERDNWVKRLPGQQDDAEALWVYVPEVVVVKDHLSGARKMIGTAEKQALMF